MVTRSHPYDDILHEVVEHGGVLHLAGVVSEDLSLDMEGQTRDALAQIDRLLVRHGSGRDRLLTALLFVTDMSGKPGMNRAWKEWLRPDQTPARATLGVADLGPGVLIEIVVTAAKG